MIPIGVDRSVCLLFSSLGGTVFSDSKVNFAVGGRFLMFSPVLNFAGLLLARKKIAASSTEAEPLL